MANQQKSFYQRLTRLFRSGPAIRRKVKGQDYKNFYDNQVVQNNLGYYGAAGFKREASPFSVMGAYGILDRMSRYCLTGETEVATNSKKGTVRMDELVKMFSGEKPPELIHTFAYDHKTNSIVLAEIENAFFTKEAEITEVELDNGKIVRCTADHRFMLRDGAYVQAQNLKNGDALMPFYRKNLKKYKNGNIYRAIYSPSDGWCGEHKIVGNYLFGRKILSEDNKHIHHKNFCGIDNDANNLEIMDKNEHMLMHARDGQISSDRKSAYWDKKLQGNPSINSLKFTGRKNGFPTWQSFITEYKNHKVVSVKNTGIIEKVYDITVKDYHNFAINQGVIVHNSEFSEMENTAEIATALNVYADESCATDEKGKTFHIHSENSQVQKALEDLFYEVVNIEFNARRMIRNLVKNGDYFCYVEVAPDFGIINVEPLPVNEIEREEGFDKHDPYAVRFRLITRGGKYLENWQMLHFRILGNDLFLPYGTSFLESARRSWRQLCHLSGTRVLTEGGYKNIEDIISGEYVYTHCPELNSTVKAKVKHVVGMGVQNIVSVETSHRTIKVTPNHGLLVKNKDGVFIYKKAIDLISSDGEDGNKSRDSDKLVLPSVMSGEPALYLNFNDVSSAYSVKLVNKAANIERKGIVNRLKNLGASTGYKNIHSFLNGDRKISWADYQLVKKEFCLTGPVKYYYKQSKKESLFFDFTKQVYGFDKDFIKFFGFMLGDGWVNKNGLGFALGVHDQQNEEYINYAAKIFGEQYSYSRITGTKSAQVNWVNTEAAHIFRHLDFKTGFASKHIPSWVYNLNLECRRSLIQGMFDVDGCVNTKTICFANRKLIEQTQELCWTIGIPVGKTIAVRPERPGHKESYSLWIDLSKESMDVVYENVLRVTEQENGQTWDLEVEHEEHNFIANGIVTHNTMMEDAMLVYRLVRSPERRVFYVDVSAVHPNDIPSYMEAVKEGLRGASVIDQQQGRQDFRYNPLAVDEDYFLPTRPNNQTKIENLPGGANATATEDVEYIQKKLIAALMVPKAYLTYDEAISCLVGETQVPLLDGTNPTIKELTDRFSAGELTEAYCYSTLLDGTVVPGKINKAWATKKVNSAYRIHLDNGEYIDCTENHPFLLKSGTYKRADELIVNDSLMPVYKKLSSKQDKDMLDGYEMVFDNKTGEWKYTHKMSSDWRAENAGGYSIGKQRVVHHIDFNKLNNSPRNLQEMTWYSHRKLHSENLSATILHPDVVIEREPKRLAALASSRHRTIKSKQIKQQMADPKSALRSWVHGKQIKESVSRSIKAAWKTEEYRSLKTKQNKEILQRPEVREKIFGKNHWAVKATKHFDLSWLVKFCKENNVTEYLYFKKSYKNKAPCSSRVIERIFRENNISGWRDFEKQHLCFNHKVAHIEIKEYINEDVWVYDLEIESTHNFLVKQGVVVHNSKSTLAQEDIRFSRTIATLQKIMIAELNKLAIIHLYALGFSGEDLLNFELNFSNPSTVAVQQKLALISTKIETAAKAWEMSKETGIMSMPYIQKEILGLRTEEINQIRLEARQDQIDMAELKKIAENPPFDESIESSIDIFDKGNYKVPSSPFAPDKKDLRDIENKNLEDERELRSRRQKEKREREGNSSELPIKFSSTPNLDKAFRRNKRSKEFDGDRALANPNFAKMLDPVKNRYAKDLYDTETLNSINKFTLEEQKIRKDLLDFNPYPHRMSKEMKASLRKMNESLRSVIDINGIELVTENNEEITDDLFLIEKDLKTEE